jgi:uncharacterized protein (DUF302 family)
MADLLMTRQYCELTKKEIGGSTTMAIRRINVERFSVISSKSFEDVVAALKAAVGQPDMVKFLRATERAPTFTELEHAVQRSLGSSGLMIFMEMNSGAVLRKETGMGTPKIIRFLIGNPLIMKEMAKHVPDAASYAPVTILVDERPDGVHLSYDRMASFLSPYGNAEALKVAQELDAKVEALLASCEKNFKNQKTSNVPRAEGRGDRPQH